MFTTNAEARKMSSSIEIGDGEIVNGLNRVAIQIRNAIPTAATVAITVRTKKASLHFP
jgi:hypothetical protein